MKSPKVELCFATVGGVLHRCSGACRQSNINSARLSNHNMHRNGASLRWEVQCIEGDVLTVSMFHELHRERNLETFELVSL